MPPLAEKSPAVVQSPIDAPATPPPIEDTWTRISRIVRKLDEDKVKDYKEDIDTILVFAGLFSAVLTAFLVQSYQTLQQDPMDTVVSLLQQIALQTSSFVVTSTFLNSTVPSPGTDTSLAFHPSLNAQRINILWFASLVISLSTASFGIVVKQWLREYLAGDYTSPQARLRIRHFRYPGLERWKVFEIAAVLPLFLQISLALFLVGLCYFTAEVHNSIGRTTLPLVSAWGFFLVAVTFVPIIAPVCPYKTSLLKDSMNAFRQQIFRVTALCISFVSPHRLPRFLVSKAFRARNAGRALLYDEEQVVRNEKHDIEILLAVDAIQADDQLLNDVMWEALQQADLDPEELAKFLFTVVGHRAQCDVLVLLPRQFLNLKALPKQTYAAVMDMVADLIVREAERLSLDTSSTSSSSDTPTGGALEEWLNHSICLLLSDSKFLHSDRVNKVLHYCLSEGRHQLVSRLIHSRIDILTDTSDTFLFVLQRLKGGLALVDDTKQFMSIMQHLFQQPLSLPSPALAPGLQAIADDRRSILEGDGYFYVPPNCRDLVIELFVPRIQEAVEKGQWTTSHYVLLTRTLELSYAGNASTTGNAIRQPVIKVIEKLLKSPSLGSVYVVHEIALGMSKQSNTVKLAAQNAYIDAVMSSSKQERSEILSRFVAFVKLHSQDHHFVDTVGTSTTSVTFDPLSSCLLHLRLIRRIQNVEGEPYSHHKHLWKLIFELLLPRLQLAVLWSRAEHKDVATECLTLIDTIEPMGRGVHQNHPSVLLTRSLPSSRSSLFADDLIRTLSDFLPYPAPASTWRMQRLKLLESRKPAHWQIVKRTGANLGKTISPVPVAQLAREVSQGHDGAERGDSGGAAGDPLAEILAVLGRQPLGQPPADRDATPPQVPNVDVPEETSQSAQPARHHETVAHPPLRGVPEQTRWTDVLSHTPVIATLAATFDGPPPDTEAALDEALPVESQPAAEEPTTAISIAAEMSTTPLLASLLSRIGVSDSGELQGLDLEDEVPVHPRLGRILEILDLTVKPVSTTTNQTNIDGHPDALPSTNTSDESGLAEEQSEMMPSSYVATPTRQKETETKEQLRGPPEDRPAIPVDLSLSRIDEENEQRMEDSFIASSQHNAHTIFVEASLVPSRNSIARDESQDHTQSPKSSTPGDQPPETAFSPTPVEPSDEAHSSMGLPLARYKEEDGPPSYSIMPKPDPWDLSLESIEWPFPLWSDPVQNSMQDDASLLGWLSHLNREANASDPITNDRFTRPEATAYSTTGNGLFEDASYGSTKRISSEEEDLELPNDELLDSIDEPSVVVLQDPDDSEFPVQSGDHAEVISEAGNASGGRDSEELSYVDIEQWRGDANT